MKPLFAQLCLGIVGSRRRDTADDKELIRQYLKTRLATGEKQER